MRERIEDLGRLAVMLDGLLDHSIWEIYAGRNKDFVEYFYNLTEEKQHDVLHDLIYGIGSIREKIGDMRCIAYGTDPLNDPITV